ncbi:hypothetical protein VPH35_026247 [Triticum aestivum]
MDTEVYSVYDVPITQLLNVPRDESNIEECWEAPLGPPTYMMEANLTRDAAPATTLPESGCTRKRGPRKRRIPLCTDKSWFLGNHFGGDGKNRGLRTNNEHWTPEEVTALVDGVEDLGVGRWSALKKKWFSTSVRTAVNLKDKWRNLLRSYTGNAERGCYLQLDHSLIQRIQKVAAENPYLS